MIIVEHIDHMGSDLSVVNAARVSFAKESDWEHLILSEDERKAREVELDEEGWKGIDTFYDPYYGHEFVRLKPADKKLIHYLAEHKHTSPFGHAFASFRVKAPVFVARQLVKHKFLRWNETSRRYVDDPPTFFTPDKWRKRADNVKQGSSDEEVGFLRMLGLKPQSVNDGVERFHTYVEDLYDDMIEAGVCPEQARMVLPQSMFTEWVWSGSLDAFADMCKLRLDPHTQQETREVAKQISDTMHDLFPVSWKALIDA
jgi:thymidylate synthase (FAD)